MFSFCSSIKSSLKYSFCRRLKTVGTSFSRMKTRSESVKTVDFRRISANARLKYACTSALAFVQIRSKLHRFNASHLNRCILMLFPVRANGIEYRFIPRELTRKGAKDTVKAEFDFVFIRLSHKHHSPLCYCLFSLKFLSLKRAEKRR